MGKNSQVTARDEELVGEQGAEKFDLPDNKNYFKVIMIKTVFSSELQNPGKTHTYMEI